MHATIEIYKNKKKSNIQKMLTYTCVYTILVYSNKIKNINNGIKLPCVYFK